MNITQTNNEIISSSYYGIFDKLDSKMLEETFESLMKEKQEIIDFISNYENTLQLKQFRLKIIDEMIPIVRKSIKK